MSDLTIGVQGMTCGHCVQSVSGAVAGVDGVDDVEVNLDAGQVTVKGAGIDEATVRSAIVDAGYEVTS